MKLARWARRQGVSRQTAARWFHAGQLPVAAGQLPTGAIVVDAPAWGAGEVAVCARVSSSDQRADLGRQVACLAAAVAAAGLAPSRVVVEVGSGLNGSRPRLRRLLADSDVATVVVERRDRLARFGVEWVEAVLAAHGRQLVVLDDGEVGDDLVRDMVEVLASMCARLYGRRSENPVPAGPAGGSTARSKTPPWRRCAGCLRTRPPGTAASSLSPAGGIRRRRRARRAAM